jgi:serine/threonine-protein kinase SRPK3
MGRTGGIQSRALQNQRVSLEFSLTCAPLFAPMPFKKTFLRKFRTAICAIKSFSWRKLIPLPTLSRVKRRSLDTLTVYPSNAGESCLPGHGWNVLEVGEDERYASLADLYTHVGEQLPTQVVKLIARDVLRALEHLHEARGVAHGGK